MTKEEIGAVLKSARERRGLTQLQVAETLGKRQQTIGNWETGYAQPDANTLFALCDLYNISIDDAFGGGRHVVVSSSEKEHLEKYRTLDDHGKRVVDFLLNEEAARVAASKEKEQGHKHLTDEEAIALVAKRYGHLFNTDPAEDEEISG